MTDPRKSLASPAVLMVALLTFGVGCDFFSRTPNPLGGTGPAAMDPYMGRPSGAIRLGLQLYNGCGVLGDGSNTGVGTVNFTYPYPATCQDLNLVTRPATARRPMPVVTGVPYFLDQLTIAEVVHNLHTDPKDLATPLKWITTQSVFKGLDWNGVGVTADEWEGDRAAIGGFFREVHFSGGAWMSVHHGDSFRVEILDADGKVVAEQDYPNKGYALTTAMGGHVQFSFKYGIVGKPEFLGDTRLNPLPPQPLGSPPVRPPTFRTMARLDLVGLGTPHDLTLTIPEALRGDGVARVTWSLKPAEPFFFPLTFTHPSEPDFPQCWRGAGEQERVPCDFGVDPQASFTAPRNGKFYEPGETLQMVVKVTDGLGNLLHPPDALPSYNDFLAGRSNGILYQFGNHNGVYGERNVWSSMSVQGPIQLLRPFYGREGANPWFGQFGRGSLPNAAAVNNLKVGARDVPGETRWPIALPEGAKAGTYVATVKINRQFMGERVTRTNVSYFQVGQEEKTSYPQRVGNCDICHKGPTSLSNLAMGMESSAVEACKSCHSASTGRFIHRVHMTSPHYPMKRNDCAVCHLTRESTLRASLYVCNSCHQQSHGAQYFDQALTAVTTSPDPNLMSACAVTCHSLTTPTQHLLPLDRMGAHQ